MRQNKRSPELSKEVIAAIITGVTTVLAAVIGGIFILRSVSSSQTPLPTPILNNPTVIITQQPTQPIATQGVTPQTGSSPTGSAGPYGGTLVLSDPLKDNSQSHQWDRSTDSSGSSCDFKNNTYDVIAAQGYYEECNTNAPNTVFSNFAYQVSMTIVQGDFISGAEGGIVFRYNDSTKSFYMLMFTSSGSYQLYAFINKAPIQPPIMTGVADQFNRGTGATNLIAVVANGNNIKIFVNQSQDPLFSVLDTRISSGQIGVIALGGQQSVGEATFNYAQVWRL